LEVVFADGLGEDLDGAIHILALLILGAFADTHKLDHAEEDAHQAGDHREAHDGVQPHEQQEMGVVDHQVDHGGDDDAALVDHKLSHGAREAVGGAEPAGLLGLVHTAGEVEHHGQQDE